ncbi:MAG: glucose-1-phosphate adenylyltransferase [Acidimicrobiales bacterium]|nr:glucose-1-phosphate adenylyltransferase [Acidimicrobiales bacterium]
MVDPSRVLCMVLAGGEGKRLAPLTADRAKPAVPYGGHYRLIDFVLSNLVNAGYRRIIVLTQYKSHSLDVHLSRTWPLSTLLGNYVTSVPAQMRRGPYWFSGSADAIFQNVNIINDEQPDYILVFGADHIYRMDPRQMVDQHVETGAGVTVAALRVPVAESDQFGVLEMKQGTTIGRFREKPTDVQGLDDDPSMTLGSMGNYVFSTETLLDVLNTDALDSSSAHDVGGSIIPLLVDSGIAHAYDFTNNVVPGATERDQGYWRDVGSLDAFYDSHMELVAVHPVFNLYNRDWPILTSVGSLPPAKFVLDEDGRTGMAINSIVCAGAIVSGGTVRRSVISPNVFVDAGALVEDSVLMHDVRVGAGAIVRKAIIDKSVVVPPGARIGVDPDLDAERFTVSPNGVVVIGKHQPVPHG